MIARVVHSLSGKGRYLTFFDGADRSRGWAGLSTQPSSLIVDLGLDATLEPDLAQTESGSEAGTGGSLASLEALHLVVTAFERLTRIESARACSEV